MISKLLTTGAALVLVPALASAQGANNCGSAQAISGLGSWSVNNFTATTDGPAMCTDHDNDVWFEWTATSTDNFSIDTCGSGFDTVLAVYPSGCPASGAIACNDDGPCPGNTSTVAIAGVNGTSYLIQVSGWQGAQGSGTLNIATGGTPGGGCPDPVTGPDVIVGELNGISNWGGSGTKGGYSIGTTSCNSGDTGLLWVSSTNQHPVIGQNIYRLKDGRFEQIGQGWLKHGFLALAQNLCCSCNDPFDGSILGVGCSDPYGSGLNGQQGGLGPRSEVNAHTGAFSYPFGSQGATGNAIYKRIQVENDDLNPALNAGATYYGEGQYIAPDDAAAGNGNNNTSWVPITVNGAGGGGFFNLGLNPSQTVREESAIKAWEDADSGVVLTESQVPGDGVFILGSRAYDNGDGTYDYEYAVYNMNVDASCGSVSVPIMPGTSVTNIGFHDCDSHSGEPYSNTDWAGVAGASSVDWATDTFGMNPNANAIRWGTLYNVRFTANAAPVSGSIDLGLFKTGGSISVAAEVPGMPVGGPTPPANDTCATPQAIMGTGAFAYDNTDATASGFAGGGCATGEGGAVNSDVFFVWTAMVDGDYTFDTCVDTTDTILNLYDGSDCSATCIGGNDDDCGSASSFDQAGLVAGDVLLIQLGYWSDSAAGAAGTLTISVTIPPPPGPANDDCATPDAIMGEGAFAFDTTLATSSGFDGGDAVTCATAQGGVPPQFDIFFAWTADSDNDFRFDTCVGGGATDTIINVHVGADCSATCLQSDDDGCGGTGVESQTDVLGILTGQTYLIQIGAWGGAPEGPGTLTVSVVTPPPPPPANNDCATPEAIVGLGSFAWNNEFATSSGFNGGEIASSGGQNCYATGAGTGLDQEIANDVFFAWTSPCDGDFVFDTTGSAVVDDTKLNIHSGSDCSAVCYVANDDNATPGDFLSEATVTGVLEGETYLIQVGLFAPTSTAGDGVLNISRVGGDCPTFGVTIECDPANNHFQGNSAKLDASTFGSGVGSGLHLSGTDGPTLQWGFFLVSSGGNSNLPVNSGILCLDQPTARYNVNVSTNQGLPQLNSICRFDANGDLENFAGTGTSAGGFGFDVPTELPFTPAGQTIQSGDTWYFQLWYRDQVAMPGDSSNFSNMVCATFP